MTVEQPQSGFQDSSQPYQSLAVAQNGQFSPSMEGSHSPFLAGKGAGTLPGTTTYISILYPGRFARCLNFPCVFQESQSRATTPLTGRGSRHPSGLSSPRQASPLPSHTRLWRPALRIPPSNTAPVWPNGKTPIRKGRTERATSLRCQHIQVRF